MQATDPPAPLDTLMGLQAFLDARNPESESLDYKQDLTGDVAVKSAVVV